ncbi:hypothetical protein MUU46_04730 [Scandinavium sp. TWS1a]|uniref:hypothetical protein n=1 Tax=Scandinavium tedordense TaxID=2926521 RepID=UPI002165ABB8|nr:hypothetical protein [Scandinavium tedordense]MCS2169627.1 hypothetical protein [Scandinavium tedordense]
MSVKEQFLSKLRAPKNTDGPFNNKGQADVAQFQSRMIQLRETMAGWLEGTGIDIESIDVSLIELLIGEGTFGVPGIVLRLGDHKVTFTPVFLYGQGVTGCVNVSLCAAGRMSQLCRLFMRSSEHDSWSWSPGYGGNRKALDEEAFFLIIGGLLE